MKWHTEVRKVAELKGWESNPRTITTEKFDELVSSVDELGNFEPLVIDIDGTVIAGNQRLKVAQKLGDTEIEVSVPERKLTDKEIKRIGLISNRHSGEWDMDMLANEFGGVLAEFGLEDLISPIDEDNSNNEVDRSSISYKTTYQIIIECENELQQRDTYNDLSESGYKCKVLTL